MVFVVSLDPWTLLLGCRDHFVEQSKTGKVLVFLHLPDQLGNYALCIYHTVRCYLSHSLVLSSKVYR